ncbi:LysR substrate-binding domain-containing protein [Acuticoccus mangrovi]|uniref:LysR family transcriptional regulator n=1 Tax=Acuticoccus mangrovi TaxID=2796142 RepID=A0A934IK42_9HYPH|nr:LysR substrate-binding domain-containing protein [Acuticoccus mangrovi]MBJ3778144.1 LysR family transcriptional regulator [Acuticoccus mangrovi]
MAKRTSLPPLNPLHVFEAAARLESFTKAARVLNITQSAVSRQIAALEASLNVMLFTRGKEGTALTEAGRYYRDEVTAAFSRIQSATDEIRNQREASPLRVRVYTTFAAQWLIPRLPDFQAKHPEIKVQVSTATAPVVFSRDRVDLAIQLGDGMWPGVNARPVFPDVIQPVCSKEVVRRVGSAKVSDILREVPMIETGLRSRDWPDWLAHNHIAVDDCEYMRFPNSLLAYQAALAGLGVAMGQMMFLSRELEEGRLVRLGTQPLKRDVGYFALWPEAIPMNRKIRAFLAWVTATAERDTQTMFRSMLSEVA